MQPSEFLSTHGADIADMYARMLHTPNSVLTETTYRAFKGELLDQFASMRQSITVSLWPNCSQPYRDSAEMFADVANERHLFVYAGMDLPLDHPMQEHADHTLNVPWPATWTLNHVFRAVHDYYGHYVNGCSFGPVGEECAFRCHRLMFTSVAQWALVCETRAQSCAFNYGPDRHIPRNRRPFPIQKAGILPYFAVFGV